MESLAGPYYAAALLLGAAGVIKAANPAATVAALRAAALPAHPVLVRALGAAEVAVAGLAMAGGVAGAMLLAAAYAGFAVYAWRAGPRAAACGCFGAAHAPVGPLHVALNVALAAVAMVVALAPLPGPGRVVAAEPAAGVPLALLVAATAYLLYLVMTRYAALRRLVHR